MRFKEWWKALVGAAQVLLSVFDWAARIDFLKNQLEPGSLAAQVMKFIIEHFPFWVALAIGLIGTALILWNIVEFRHRYREVKPHRSPKQPGPLIVIEPGANVEGPVVRRAEIPGTLLRVGGSLIGGTFEDIRVVPPGSSTFVGQLDSGYFGPPRTWLIPDKFWVAECPTINNSDGTFSIIHIVAIRGEFAPDTLTVILAGSGLISAKITPYMKDGVIDSGAAKENRISLSVQKPSGTYHLHVVRSETNEKILTNFHLQR
jgi:hypothetical protein